MLAFPAEMDEFTNVTLSNGLQCWFWFRQTASQLQPARWLRFGCVVVVFWLHSEHSQNTARTQPAL